MRAYERLLQYVSFMTPSDEESDTIPSSNCQFALAEHLARELRSLGLEDAYVDSSCYVYGHLPATKGYEHKTAIGFIAHMDTVSDFCDRPVSPVITKAYDGKELVLGQSGCVLSPSMFPHLPALKGKTLITTDGTTILGADDKAGIAEIMTMLEMLAKEEISHGPICVGFTPDEEVGKGADHFDVQKFGAEFAYTMDGETLGEIQFENFHAGAALVHIKGVNVHPGASKDVMVNASLVAMEFQSMLPGGDIPRHTKDYEGFFHLTSMEGNVGKASLSYIIRDHDKASYEMRKKMLFHITELLNEKWGDGCVTLEYKEQYQNMNEIIKKYPHLIEYAKEACDTAGVEPLIIPIRGGTDGARLSFMGLPCPNLGTGGHAFHGPYEHIAAEDMDQAVQIILELVQIFAKA